MGVCTLCLGKYSGPFTHSHTMADTYDERFASCRVCKGHGAFTCPRCCGTGHLDSKGGPDYKTAALKETAALQNMVQTPKGMTPAKAPTTVQSLKKLIAKGLASDKH